MSEISLEDLLKSLEEAEEKKETKTPVHKDLSHMDRYIQDSDIRIGTDKIPNYIVYYHYICVWQGVQSRDKKANKIKFFRALNKRFEKARGRNGKYRYYLFNKEAFELSRERLLKAEHYDKKNNEKINKKKQGKASKSKKESKLKK